VGAAAGAAGCEGAGVSFRQAASKRTAITHKRLIVAGFYFGVIHGQNHVKESVMDDSEREGNGEEFEEQFEQMLIENGVLVHALAALLVRKGILKQEEIDSEMDRLYDEMENFDQE